MKEIKNLINNKTFIVQDPEKSEPVTPCMYFYKAKIQSDGSLDKLKLIIVARGDLQNKEPVGYTCSPTASTINLKYLLAYAVKHKAIFHQLGFIEALFQANFNNRVFVKLGSRYVDYFQNIQITLEET